MERCHFDLDTKDMIINTGNTKDMIIKSKNDTYANFICDNNNIHEVTSYKYLSIDIQH